MENIMDQANTEFMVNIARIAFILIGAVGIPFLLFTLQGLIFHRFVLAKLDYKCDFSVKEAHEGDIITLTETFENRKAMPIPWLKVQISTSKWLDFIDMESVEAQDSRFMTSTLKLKGHEKLTRQWKLKCMKDGEYAIETVHFVSGDFSKVFTKSTGLTLDKKINVIPAA